MVGRHAIGNDEPGAGDVVLGCRQGTRGWAVLPATAGNRRVVAAGGARGSAWVARASGVSGHGWTRGEVVGPRLATEAGGGVGSGSWRTWGGGRGGVGADGASVAREAAVVRPN